MATIQTRQTADGKNTYRVMVRLKGHPPQTATFTRLTDARRWAQQTESAIREGRHFHTTEAKKRTLADLIDRYVAEVLPRKRPATQEAQHYQYAWWRSEVGHLALADVTPPLLAEYRDRLAAKTNIRGTTNSAAYVNRHLAALSHAFTIAVKEWQWCEENPLLKVTKPKEPRGRVRFLSDDEPDGTPGERTRLLAACKASRSPDLYPAVILALSTGARAQEILGLRWPQIDLPRKVAVLEETKNGERRVLPLSGLALELLRARGRVRRLGVELVFPGRMHPDKPLDLRAPFETALKVAGIENFRWHDLRHSAASYLAMNGATLAEIASVLGHKTLAMVGRYSHLSEAHTADVVERMNTKIFGA